MREGKKEQRSNSADLQVPWGEVFVWCFLSISNSMPSLFHWCRQRLTTTERIKMHTKNSFTDTSKLNVSKLNTGENIIYLLKSWLSETSQHMHCSIFWITLILPAIFLMVILQWRLLRLWTITILFWTNFLFIGWEKWSWMKTNSSCIMSFLACCHN